MTAATVTIAHLHPDVTAIDGDAGRLAQLRQLSATDPDSARDATWEWLSEFTDLRQHHRLAWLFDRGQAPLPPDGDCEGMVLGLDGTLWLTGVDRLVRAGRVLGGIGWTGKSFDPARGTGYNRLTASSRIPMGMAMPRYEFSRIAGELIGFHFDHQREASPLSPHHDVLSIRYDRPAYGNPLVLPRTRDELVELVPHAYLGRALLMERGRWQVVGYFALRYPVQQGVSRGR